MSQEDRNLLQRIGAFFVECYFHCPVFDEERLRLPPHKLVIEPIVAAAREIRVYSAPKEGRIRESISEIVLKRRGYLELNLNKTIVRGHEVFWNAGAWQRGAIAIVSDINDDALGEIFYSCSGPNIWASLYQLKNGTPSSAIQFCKTVCSGGNLTAFLFSASNGIQWMDVFCHSSRLEKLFSLATSKCRPFKRECEANEGCDEIIIDLPPYSTAGITLD